MSNSNTKVEKLIEDLTLFYVRENYLNHLKENNIKRGPTIVNVITAIVYRRMLIIAFMNLISLLHQRA